ncbi:cobyrinate a,c-diamide synthase [Desulfococcaceae bacterium HSG7]|nr:cobyrinate a,c-diamide synthase [Desulfococcaceae bacterium HSG7]
MDFSKIIIAAMRGGAGKTILSIGIIAAWRARGHQIAPFKKGPDYIDAGWLAMAGGRSCYNLDSFLITPDNLRESFYSHTPENHIAVIEGNRGLYDGSDQHGSTSTAELSKMLDIPVILCLDCTKSTRTVAASVLGCLHFDSNVNIAGVVLNRVAGHRHETVIRRTVEQRCGVSVLGAVPKLHKQRFPERHMGLVPIPEHVWATDAIEAAADVAAQYIDLDQLMEIAQAKDSAATNTDAPQTSTATIVSSIEDSPAIPPAAAKQPAHKPRIGVAKDSAFQFYYAENLEALEASGAELIYISPLTDSTIPELDALYIGGGFPETHAQELADNVAFRTVLKELAENGLPIYAECGGLMYLGESLVLDEIIYPMTGLLPIVFGLSSRPQGHGYTVISVKRKNPFFEMGTEIKGHEFHYSHILEWKGGPDDLAFDMRRGTGFIDNQDGICYKNILATYTHIHALGTPSWTQAMIHNAQQYRNS